MRAEFKDTVLDNTSANALAIKHAKEIDALRIIKRELVSALEDAEFLMRQAGKFPGPMHDSFNRSSQYARETLERAKQ